MKFILGHTRRGRTATMAQRLTQSVRQKAYGTRVPFNEDVRRKMSEAGRRRPPHLHPRWKGGVTPERQSSKLAKWAKAVKARDGHRCQICGSTHDVHAHHLWSFAEFPDKRYDIDNGVTLCEPCHYRKPVHRTPRTLADLMFADLR